MMIRMHIAVIGAGIVGAACALELQRDGHEITLVDPGKPGGEQAASYGNGCWLSPSSVVPLSAPGLIRKVPGWLRDPLGPLALRWSHLPQARARPIGAPLPPLVADSPARHRALAEEAGVGALIRRDRLLYVFPTRS